MDRPSTVRIAALLLSPNRAKSGAKYVADVSVSVERVLCAESAAHFHGYAALSAESGGAAVG